MERLDLDKSKEAGKTYIETPIMHFITMFLWCSAAFLFRKRVKISVRRECPRGTMAALGGNRKRNITTFGMANG